MEEILGFIAGTCTTICFVPQAIKIIREKQVKGVSLSMYVIFATGLCFWFVYGILIESIPIIVFNLVTFILTSFIIYNLVKYKKNV